jgi:hypothetical protein
LIDYLTKNFVVLSAIVIALASALTMLFLTVYLAFFDWTLIWLIEYSDLAKFFLLGTALLCALFLIFNAVIPQAGIWIDKALPYRWAFFLAFGLILIAPPVWTIFSELRNEGWDFSKVSSYNVLRLSSYAAAMALIWTCTRHHQKWKQRDWETIINDVTVFAACVAIFASTFAAFVRDQSLVTRTIATKSETFRDTRIVLFLSHHLAFYSYGNVYVIPTGDVVEITSAPKQPPK